MKIFIFIHQSSAAKFIMADIAYAAMELGIEIKFIDFDKLIKEIRHLSVQEKYNKAAELMVEIKEFQPDVVFAYGLEYLNDFPAKMLQGMSVPLYSLLKLPCVSFFFDFGYPFDGSKNSEQLRLLSSIQNHDNMFLCWDNDAIKIMKNKYGVSKTFYFPMAVNEKVFYEEIKLKDRKNNIIFIGGPTEDRIIHLEQIADLGLKIYGYQEEIWKKFSKLSNCYIRAIFNQTEVRKEYNQSKISVNITREHGSSSLNMRVYEAMACGNLMMTDNKSDAKKLFEPDKEIVIYNNPEDLKIKTEYFLNNKEQLYKIAERGRQKVLNNHLYKHRLQEVIPIVVKFLNENRLFRKIDDLAKNDFGKVLLLLQDKQIKAEAEYNLDNYLYNLCFVNYKLENISRAELFMKKLMKVNPNHYMGLRLKKKFEPAGSIV